jgi:RNA polymerase sigma factor (sigma-70 family)
MTSDQQRAAHTRQDWRALWLDGLPLVRFTLTRMRANGELLSPVDDDLLQEGYLAAGEAVRLWQPPLGAFSTFLVSWIRGRLLTYLNKAGSSFSGRAVVAGPLPDETVDGPGTSYAYTASEPEGYADPLEETEATQRTAHLRYALGLLSATDRQLLVNLFGLDGDRWTAENYRRAYRLPLATVNWRKRQALKKLFRLMPGTSLKERHAEG